VQVPPAQGYDLAVKMSRVAVKMTQPDAKARDRMRPEYAEGTGALIAVSQVVVAQAYWKGAQ